MAKECKYGPELNLNLTLTNPKMTIVMGDAIIGVNDDSGKYVGGVIHALGGGIRVRVEDDDYDLSATDLWNAVVNAIGKPHLEFKKK